MLASRYNYTLQANNSTSNVRELAYPHGSCASACGTLSPLGVGVGVGV